MCPYCCQGAPSCFLQTKLQGLCAHQNRDCCPTLSNDRQSGGNFKDTPCRDIPILSGVKFDTYLRPALSTLLRQELIFSVRYFPPSPFYLWTQLWIQQLNLRVWTIGTLVAAVLNNDRHRACKKTTTPTHHPQHSPHHLTTVTRQYRRGSSPSNGQ